MTQSPNKQRSCCVWKQQNENRRGNSIIWTNSFRWAPLASALFKYFFLCLGDARVYSADAGAERTWRLRFERFEPPKFKAQIFYVLDIFSESATVLTQFRHWKSLVRQQNITAPVSLCYEWLQATNTSVCLVLSLEKSHRKCLKKSTEKLFLLLLFFAVNFT